MTSTSSGTHDALRRFQAASTGMIPLRGVPPIATFHSESALAPVPAHGGEYIRAFAPGPTAPRP